MSFVNNINKIADRFERKILKLAEDLPETKQLSTNYLFFGGDQEAVDFGNSFGTIKIKDNGPDKDPTVIGTGPVAEAVVNFWKKKGASCSVDMSVTADPSSKSASFNIKIEPSAAASIIYPIINKLYKEKRGKDMKTVLPEIKQKVVQNSAGSGTVHTKKLELLA